MSLGYAYTNNAGTAKTGTVNINYQSTSHNSVLGAPNPAGTVRVKVGVSKQIQVIFTTNDGNTATNFKVTSDLTALPAGWSGTNGFACAAVNSGTGCSLPLNYAPVTNATGTLTLNFSYTDSAFTAQTGSAAVQYSNPHLYTFGSEDYICSIIADGSLDTCALTATSADTANAYGPGVIVGAYAYIPGTSPDFYTCSFENDGTLDACAGTVLENNAVYGFATSGSYMYINYYENFYVCTFGAAGSLTNCALTASSIPYAYDYGVAVNASFAYMVNYVTPVMCVVSATDGTLNSCSDITYTANNTALSGAGGIKIYGNYVYTTGSSGITTCAIAVDGSLPTCNSFSVGGSPYDITILGTDAYIASGADILHCTVDQTTGTLSACAVSDGNGSNFFASGLLAQ